MGNGRSDDQRVGDWDEFQTGPVLQRRVWVQTLGHYDISDSETATIQEAIRTIIRFHVCTSERERWASILQPYYGTQSVAGEETKGQAILEELRQLYRLGVNDSVDRENTSGKNKRLENKQSKTYWPYVNSSSTSSPFSRRVGPRSYSYLDERKRHYFRPYDGKRHYGSSRKGP